MRLALLTALAVLVLAPAASARTLDVVAALGSQLDRVADRTSVPVRVPAQLNIGYDGRVYVEHVATRSRYAFRLAGAPRCGNANACSLGELTGRRGARPSYRRTVRLRGGRTGYYKPLTCGGSCSDPEIQWRQGDVLYAISASLGVSGAGRQRAAMVAAANSAIAARAR